VYFSVGNGHPREPALCQLYRLTCVAFCLPTVDGVSVHCVVVICTQKAQVPLDDYEIEKVLFRLDAGKEGKISYQYVLTVCSV